MSGREGSNVRLRDGSLMTVRPIHQGDRSILLEHFEHLGAEARYHRFLAPVKRLTDGQIECFTHPDHRSHEALFALDQDGHPVGVARYISSPDDHASAEIAAAVVDDWQGRGVGHALVTGLAQAAHRAGIRRFTALMQAENRPMQRLLADLGPVEVLNRDAASIEVAVALDEAANGQGPTSSA